MAAAGLAVQDVVGILAKHGQKMGALGDVRGLCAPIDRMALKSSFNNGGRAFSAAVIIPEGLGSAPPRITMRAAAKTAYICQDCGYIYNDKQPFTSLPTDYSCPVCLAPKRRFKVYDAPVARNANDLAVRKARKEELKKTNAAFGQALPIGIAVGILGIVGTFLYLNSTL
ncbi:uncharacterized protein [Physcomitrium patens]|uniref:Rubredoxin-like domain-containing protein n=1 Tax=Physcomitrium patens TaxID=3218 RepID=A0A2K1IUI3_PHYPA|nr:uncharacterized protein LOC112273566 [Physcomitrium patens]PNR32943.1 hypothetical protein PHYPA_024886 [Physcomitrium patens]|eukprot:XP_024358272.1 uncharacterized protein LOC112273566 [Physcomitrella patens]